jgi:hypothetical protein
MIDASTPPLRRLALAVAALLLSASPAMTQAPVPARTAQALRASEKAVYAADFEAASEALAAPLAVSTDSDEVLLLLLQRVRVHQTQRLSGKVSPDEGVTLGAVKVVLPHVRDPALLALAGLRRTTSTYFRDLTGGDVSKSMALQPAYREAAAGLTDPCLRAEALFFAGLMPQAADNVAASAEPLAEAFQVATVGGCDLELSYVLRHQAAVRDAAGDKVGARDLMARSLEIRQKVGFKVFAPFSQLSLADAEEALGRVEAAQALRRQALEAARRLDLPAQEAAALKALAAKPG